MLSQEAVSEQEEKIRALVRALPDAQRLLFFKESSEKLKDPDTYAVLNYLFIAGLHHFYLGQWLYGLINITIFWAGAALLLMGFFALGLLCVAGVTLLELYELFRSQVIVQHCNNCMMAELYEKYAASMQKKPS